MARGALHPANWGPAPIVATSVLAALLLVEVVFGGWFGPHLNTLRVPKNVQITRDVSGHYPREAPITYTRDAHGLRGAYGGDPARIDLVTLGGSTTDQSTTDDSETWQALLGERFAAAGHPIDIANAGVDGQATPGHATAITSWLSAIDGFKPRWILVYCGVNDFYLQADADPAQLSTGQRRLRARSALWNLMLVVRGWYRVHYRYDMLGHRSVSFADATWTQQPLLTDHAARVAERLRAYRARLDRLGSAIAGTGARPIYVTQRFAPWKRDSGQVVGLDQHLRMAGLVGNGVDAHHLMAAFNAEQLAACERQGGICLDLATEISLEPSQFYDFVHPKPEGTAEIAAWLYDKLSHLSTDRLR